MTGGVLHGKVAYVTGGSRGIGRATALLLAGPGGAFCVGATLSPNGGDVMH